MCVNACLTLFSTSQPKQETHTAHTHTHQTSLLAKMNWRNWNGNDIKINIYWISSCIFIGHSVCGGTPILISRQCNGNRVIEMRQLCFFFSSRIRKCGNILIWETIVGLAQLGPAYVNASELQNELIASYAVIEIQRILYSVTSGTKCLPLDLSVCFWCQTLAYIYFLCTFAR